MSDRPTDSEMLDWLERTAKMARDTSSVFLYDTVSIRFHEQDGLRATIAAAMSASPSSSEPTP